MVQHVRQTSIRGKCRRSTDGIAWDHRSGRGCVVRPRVSARTWPRYCSLTRSESTLADAKKEIRQSLRARLMMQKVGGPADTSAVLDRILASTDLRVLQDADFIIENVTEKWDVKKDIYRVIDQCCPKRTVFAANTSAISITRIASLTTRTDRVLQDSSHPVPMKKLVEVIRGFHTSDDTLATAKRATDWFGKGLCRGE